MEVQPRAMAQQKTMPRKWDWIVEFESKNLFRHLGNADFWTKRSIYRVPAHIRELNSTAYEPQLVSLGPYHHGKRCLKPMEAHKIRAVSHIIKKSRKNLLHYAMELEKVTESLMEAYDQLDAKWTNTDRFIQLMIYDGCFLLEALRKFSDKAYGEYACNDPFFSTLAATKYMKFFLADIFRIENQVPLLLLQKLVSIEEDIADDQRARDIVYTLVLNFLQRVSHVFKIDGRPRNMSSKHCWHLLDLYQRIVVGDSSSLDTKTGGYTLYSAKQLRRDAGFKFKRSATSSIKDIAFKDDILFLPYIKITNYTGPILLNLMVFEQLHLGTDHIVCSYVHFMNSLIKSQDDLAYIKTNNITESIIEGTEASDNNIESSRQDSGANQYRIIESDLEGPEAIAKFFNDLLPVFIIEFAFTHVTVPLDKRYIQRTKKWPKRLRKWLSMAKESFLKSPWHFISFIAATAILGLTVTQTIYAVLSYKNGG